MPKENIVNLPNILSLYRLLSFPLVFYFALTKQESFRDPGKHLFAAVAHIYLVS